MKPRPSQRITLNAKTKTPSQSLSRGIEGSMRTYLALLIIGFLLSGIPTFSQNTTQSRFETPQGFTRPVVQASTFASYLRNHHLLPEGSPVLHYDGTERNYASHLAVLDVSIGKRDLQQCADAVMRLRAEYLYQQRKYDQISFNFTNGFKASYAKYRSGYSINVNGNKVYWVKSSSDHTTRGSFDKYLQQVFMYAGTLSLSKELKTKPVKNIAIGDVFIQGGSPGHSIIVMDICKDTNGKTKVMLAQSYMPAQSIHVLQNPANPESPWFDMDSSQEYLVTPDWTFKLSDLKSF